MPKLTPPSQCGFHFTRTDSDLSRWYASNREGFKPPEFEKKFYNTDVWNTDYTQPTKKIEKITVKPIKKGK